MINVLPRIDCVSASFDGAILDNASAKTRAEHSDPGLKRAPWGHGSSKPLASLSLCVQQVLVQNRMVVSKLWITYLSDNSK